MEGDKKMEVSRSFDMNWETRVMKGYPELMVYQDAYLVEYELKELKNYLPTDEAVGYAQKALELTTELKEGIVKCLKQKSKGEQMLHIVYGSSMNAVMVINYLHKIEVIIGESNEINRIRRYSKKLEHSVKYLLNNMM
jgi:hypothetical protein